ncbi:hypothetical protein LG003_11510 [Photorhabdus kleinii]|uniref:hypothetical protein n=1 Tax=Photorhabdus kleinii TaxID=768034 RepID=UPI0021D4C7AC|nr:hypothetical protein [Photorhabdus kleinii]MCT8343460.1 hypothetical protein [Photorhabdus kleinii]
MAVAVCSKNKAGYSGFIEADRADIDTSNAGLCTNSLSLNNKSKFFSFGGTILPIQELQ